MSRPARRRLPGFGLAAVLAAAAAAAGAAQQPPVFEVTSEAVEVDAYVSRGGEALEGLGAGDFEVRDNGVAQRVELVAADRAGLQAVVALDASASMTGAKLEHVKAAARAFLAGLGPRDRAELLIFRHDQRLFEPEQLEAALASAGAGGGTDLHDAVYAALELADGRRGRPVVLVLSDGFNRVSWLSAEQVLKVARDSPAVVFALEEQSPPERRVRRPEPRVRAEPRSAFLRSLAVQSGGWASSVVVGPELPAAFARVLRELHTRYLLRYEPSGLTPGWHELKVRLRGVKGELRTRRGYFRPGPTPASPAGSR